ncbi:MAG: hypothetical protein GJ676_20180 [Rhodobacteraceae bacterium]|nr:hypothetical protein [Paracoccaceae bacterium]
MPGLSLFADRKRVSWLALAVVNLVLPVLVAPLIRMQNEADLRLYLFWLTAIVLLALNESLARLFPEQKLLFWGATALNILAAFLGYLAFVILLLGVPNMLNSAV